MIEFRQKEFSEYDAMRSLYVELMKQPNRNIYGTIRSNQLISTLKGNNIVIERFVITTAFAHKDKYRMYLKIGARAKMPEAVRLQSTSRHESLFKLNLNFGNKFNGYNNQDYKNQTFEQRSHSEVVEQKEFGKKDSNGGGQNNGGGSGLGFNMNLPIEVGRDTNELLGDCVDYNKKDRSLVLEFRSIYDAIRSLSILPFGLNYRIYLLDA